MTTLAQLNAAAADMLKAADQHFDALVYGDQIIAIFPEGVDWRVQPSHESDDGKYLIWRGDTAAEDGVEGIATLVGGTDDAVRVWLRATWDTKMGEAA